MRQGQRPIAMLLLAAAPLIATGCSVKDEGLPEAEDDSPAVADESPALSLTNDIYGRGLDRTGIPPRKADAPTGSQFLAFTEGMAPEVREAAIYAEIRNGNVPEFLRALKPVTLYDNDTGRRATIWVMPDYLAIGTDEDHIHMPMSFVTATRLAEELGLSLPTRKIVDTIHEQAKHKAVPHPLPPSKDMASNDYYAKHDQIIRQDLGSYPLGELVSGHKKDVILSNKLHEVEGRIVIYGWLQPDGTPIQKISNAHDVAYADYSHGVRFISRTVVVDGAPDYYPRAIANDETAALFTGEGVIKNSTVIALKR